MPSGDRVSLRGVRLLHLHHGGKQRLDWLSTAWTAPELRLCFRIRLVERSRSLRILLPPDIDGLFRQANGFVPFSPYITSPWPR